MARIVPGPASGVLFSGAIMQSRQYLVAALAMLCATSGALRAQTIIPKLDAAGHKGDMARAEKQRAADRFDGYDANKDGKLSAEEVAGKSAYLTDNFGKLDADKDGLLSWEEYLGHNRWPK
jgi:hypothetical protein